MIKVLLFAGLLLFQSPDGEGGDDTEEGKPLSCNNYKSTTPDHRCECARAMQKCDGDLPQPPADVRMDKKCKTYCRQQHCQCAGMRCRS